MEYLTYPNEPKCQQKYTFITKLGLRFASRNTLKHEAFGVQHTYKDTSFKQNQTYGGGDVPNNASKPLAVSYLLFLSHD
jgi:hypothetical protein